MHDELVTKIMETAVGLAGRIDWRRDSARLRNITLNRNQGQVKVLPFSVKIGKLVSEYYLSGESPDLKPGEAPLFSGNNILGYKRIALRTRSEESLQAILEAVEALQASSLQV